MLFAQISDTHIRRKGKLLHHMVNPAKYLRRCVERINALSPRPDAVVATGDLVDRGKYAEYIRLRKLLQPLEMPLYVIPGNHDDREAFRRAFFDHPYLPPSGPINYTVEDYPVRIVALDSTFGRIPGGVLDDERLHWLERTLAEQPNRPTVILMHHPPFRTGIGPMDAHGFVGVETLGDIIARSPQVERILSGHIHRAMQVRWHGTLACTAPSSSHQLVLETLERNPFGLVLEPPGFALHEWTADGGMATSTMLIGRTEGPYRFDAEGRLKIR